jgi:hypothetical protein
MTPQVPMLAFPHGKTAMWADSTWLDISRAQSRSNPVNPGHLPMLGHFNMAQHGCVLGHPRDGSCGYVVAPIGPHSNMTRRAPARVSTGKNR